MSGKHRSPRPQRRRWSLPVEWRRPVAAVAILGLGVAFVVTGLIVGVLMIVWAILALAAIVVGLVLLAGDTGPEWPDFPTDHSPYAEGANDGTTAAPNRHNGASRDGPDPWSEGRLPAPPERRSPAR